MRNGQKALGVITLGLTLAVSTEGALHGGLQPERKGEAKAMKELRIGLVCYGGVSLAVYMHGVTQELHKLVRASRALELELDPNRFPADSTERVYYEALQQKQVAEGGIATRVVIDAIAGTSAGGINGILLAKALSHNLSQDELPRFWFEKADVLRLLNTRWKLVAAFKIAIHLAQKEAIFKEAKLLEWLLQALDAMDEGRERLSGQSPLAGERTLMPEDHSLDLFVTTTDYYGARRIVDIEIPAEVEEKGYGQVLHFRFDPTEKHGARNDATGIDQFDASYNPILAFAARSTSSFPVAFEPTNLGDLVKATKGRKAPFDLKKAETEFFRLYELSHDSPEVSAFIDGGLRNNAPFDPLIQALFRRPAATEVERKLVYLEPDPEGLVERPQVANPRPSTLGVAMAAINRISAAQSILPNLLGVQAFNSRVEMVKEILLHAEPEAFRIGKGLQVNLQQLEASQSKSAVSEEKALSELRLEADAIAPGEGASPFFGVYLAVRTESVVQQFAAVVNRLRDFPEGSTQAAFVQQVVRRWAERKAFIGADAEHDQQEWLRHRFDLGYTYRRVRLVAQRLNALYPKVGDPSPPSPTRQEIDAEKAFLRQLSEEMLETMRGAGLEAQLRSSIDQLFPISLPRAGVPLKEQVEAFVCVHLDEMNAIADRVGEVMERKMDRWYHSLFMRFERTTANWPSAVKDSLVAAYLGFKVLDAATYPIQRLSNAGELEPIGVVRFSPKEATAIESGGAANKLKGVDLFHFNAFLSEGYRENDFLWGRLDGAEQVLDLLGQKTTSPLLRKALLAVIDGEEERLKKMPKAELEAIRKKILAL